MRVQKTKLVRFSLNDLDPGSTSITVAGHMITSSSSAKFLGITFDVKFTFQDHVKNISVKYQKAHRVIRYICGTWWGAHPETLLVLYKSYIRSTLEYGLFLYYPKTKAIGDISEKIQFRALRTVMGYRVSTPRNIILEETSSVKDRALHLGCNYVTKALSNLGNSANKRITQFYYKQVETNRKIIRVVAACIKKVMTCTRGILYTSDMSKIYDCPYEAIYHQPEVNLSPGKVLKKFKNPGLLLDFLFFDDSSRRLFTDGILVKDSISVGSAYVNESSGTFKTCSLNSFSSIFTAEAKALNLALDHAAQLEERRHVIFSDSMSVLQALTSLDHRL